MSVVLERETVGAPVETTMDPPAVVEPEEITVLRKVEELLSDRERWTDGAGARNADGLWVGVLDDDAVQWCAVGAVMRFSDWDGGDESFSDWDGGDESSPRRTVYWNAVVRWAAFLSPSDAGYRQGEHAVIKANDDSGYDTVMRALRKAIGKEKA